MSGLVGNPEDHFSRVAAHIASEKLLRACSSKMTLILSLDDRFILKQMSSMEVESFEKFGPQYFQYIYKSEKQQVLLVI